MNTWSHFWGAIIIERVEQKEIEIWVIVNISKLVKELLRWMMEKMF